MTRTTERIFLGFDPGGRGKFGWAVCAVESGQLKTIGTGLGADASTVLSAMQEVLPPDSQIMAAGIDAPLYWVSPGPRESDKALRKAIAKQGCTTASGTVQDPNSLRGACVVQGPLLAHLLHTQFPAALLTEAHPKALLYMLGKDTTRLPAAYESLPEDERDAVLAALCAYAAHVHLDGWEDLHKRDPKAKTPFIYPVSYWMPAIPKIDTPEPVTKFPSPQPPLTATREELANAIIGLAPASQQDKTLAEVCDFIAPRLWRYLPHHPEFEFDGRPTFMDLAFKLWPNDWFRRDPYLFKTWCGDPEAFLSDILAEWTGAELAGNSWSDEEVAHTLAEACLIYHDHTVSETLHAWKGMGVTEEDLYRSFYEDLLGAVAEWRGFVVGLLEDVPRPRRRQPSTKAATKKASESGLQIRKARRRQDAAAVKRNEFCKLLSPFLEKDGQKYFGSIRLHCSQGQVRISSSSGTGGFELPCKGGWQGVVSISRISELRQALRNIAKLPDVIDTISLRIDDKRFLIANQAVGCSLAEL